MSSYTYGGVKISANNPQIEGDEFVVLTRARYVDEKSGQRVKDERSYRFPLFVAEGKPDDNKRRRDYILGLRDRALDKLAADLGLKR